ncbi:major capsid protein [Cupriavidus plantarum]|uniref:major capsid protein n=1 Tax=Cupriavidus plantarum TaxID=942865 RepID=UPI00339D3390
MKKKLQKLAVVASMGVAAAAQAAVPTEVTSALSTGATDAAAVGGGVILIVLAVKVIKWLRMAL